MSVRITREEWLASGQRLPGRYGVAMDYATLAFRLLDGESVEPLAVTVSNSGPGLVRVSPECSDVAHSIAAAMLLEEFWIPDMFPIASMTEFGF